MPAARRVERVVADWARSRENEGSLLRLVEWSRDRRSIRNVEDTGHSPWTLPSRFAASWLAQLDAVLPSPPGEGPLPLRALRLTRSILARGPDREPPPVEFHRALAATVLAVDRVLWTFARTPPPAPVHASVLVADHEPLGP
jgi:hypothetical protein